MFANLKMTEAEADSEEAARASEREFPRATAAAAGGHARAVVMTRKGEGRADADGRRTGESREGDLVTITDEIGAGLFEHILFLLGLRQTGIVGG